MKKKNFWKKFLIISMLFLGVLTGVNFFNLKNELKNNTTLVGTQKKMLAVRKKELIDTLLNYSAVFVMEKETRFSRNYFISRYLRYILRTEMIQNLHLDKNFPEFILDHPRKEAKAARFQNLQTIPETEDNPVHILRSNAYKNKIYKLNSRKVLLGNLQLLSNFLTFLDDGELPTYKLIRENKLITDEIAIFLRNIQNFFAPKNFQNEVLSIFQEILNFPSTLIDDFLKIFGVIFYNVNFFTTETDQNLFKNSELFRWIKFGEFFLDYDLDNKDFDLRTKEGTSESFSLNEILNLIKSIQKPEANIRTEKLNRLPLAPQLIKEQIVEQIMNELGKNFAKHINEIVQIDENGNFAFPQNWLSEQKNNPEFLSSLINFIKVLLFVSMNQENTFFSWTDYESQTYLKNFFTVIKKIDLAGSETGYFLQSVKENILNQDPQQNSMLRSWVVDNIDQNTFFYLSELLNSIIKNLKENYLGTNFVNFITRFANFFEMNFTEFKNLLFNKNFWSEFERLLMQLENQFNILNTHINDMPEVMDRYYEKLNDFFGAIFQLTDFTIEEIVPKLTSGIKTQPLNIFYSLKKLLIFTNWIDGYYQQNNLDIAEGLIKDLSFQNINDLLKILKNFTSKAKDFLIAFLKDIAQEGDEIENDRLVHIFFDKLIWDLSDLENAPPVWDEENPEIHPDSFFSYFYEQLTSSSLQPFLDLLFYNENNFLQFWNNAIDKELEKSFLFYLNPEKWKYEDLILDEEILSWDKAQYSDKKYYVSFKANFWEKGWNVFNYNFVWEINLKTAKVKLLNWEKLDEIIT